MTSGPRPSRLARKRRVVSDTFPFFCARPYSWGVAREGAVETAPQTAQTIAALERIVLEERQPGESVPSESELVARLGVSRLTIREATRALEARGLIEVSKGRRPRVLTPNGSVVGDFFRTAVIRDVNAIFELTEIRLAMEVQASELAASRASQAAILTMQGAIDSLAASVGDEDAFHSADMHFHASLADASGNVLLSKVLGQLEGALRVSRTYSYFGHQQHFESFDDVVAAHQLILDHVAAHDPVGAARAMRKHLKATQRDLHASVRARTQPPEKNQLSEHST